MQASPRSAAAVAAALALLAVALAWAVSAPARAWPLVAALAGLALGAELLAARLTSRLAVSAAVVAAVVAGAVGGPLAAAVVPAVSFVGAFVVDPYRWQALSINLAGSIAPSVAFAHALQAAGPPSTGSAYLLLVLAATSGVLVVSTGIVATLMAVLDARSPRSVLAAFRPAVAASAFNAAAACLSVALYVEAGAWVVAVLAFLLALATYAMRLVAHAEANARRHAALSWGVLAGLIRAMDRRDHRSARHAAAVAGFSRDLAFELGLGHVADVAHTAGLLHDLGHFALPDRVLDRGQPIALEDWEGIRRHPEIGAELLRDMGVYGPVAEIVRHHHERPDGRGYPDGLAGDRVPLLARVVAVAETYDTMTAPDTYREPLTSFEALTELRRVAGSQLDARCVEGFARLLAGRDASYRHAVTADLDRELALERRLSEAAQAG